MTLTNEHLHYYVAPAVSTVDSTPAGSHSSDANKDPR